MTRLLFPICAALLSTLAGLHLSTHLRQEEQRLARWGEVLPHLHLLMASCAYSLPEAFRLCADGNHPPDTLLRQLADTLNQASQAYYFGSEPIMSDMDWDKLYDELSALEKETGIVLPDSPTHRVGGTVSSSFEKVAHTVQMGSLQDVFSEDEVRGFLSGVMEQGAREFTVEPKIDGLSVSLEYEKR